MTALFLQKPYFIFQIVGVINQKQQTTNQKPTKSKKINGSLQIIFGQAFNILHCINIFNVIAFMFIIFLLQCHEYTYIIRYKIRLFIVTSKKLMMLLFDTCIYYIIQCTTHVVGITVN